MTDVAEDEPLRDDDLLFRRIPKLDGTDFLVVDAVTGDERPTSGAFEPDDDGISVYIDRVLRAYGLDAASLTEKPLSGVGQIRITDVSSPDGADLAVASDPWPSDVPDPAHKKHAAHALITGFDGLSRKARKREQRRLAGVCTIIYRK